MNTPLLGFDTNNKITAKDACAFFAKGYRFAFRYLTRTVPNIGDLDRDEIQIICGAGLGVACVQHVESESSWVPGVSKGHSYGAAAARQALAIGYPVGNTIACDLEGVSIASARQDIIDYCNAWYTEVAVAGYKPCLYAGWHCGLGPVDLYRALHFSSYWGAYNLDSDQVPIKRGLQIKQRSRTVFDKPDGSNLEFDVNTIHPDSLGGLPSIFGID